MLIDLPETAREQLKINRTTPANFETIRERPTHAVYRLTVGSRCYIYKTFSSPEHAKEIHVYALLRDLAVPTLPIHAAGNSYLVIEDLDTSPQWRLARPDDLRRADAGRAIAEWYRLLHAAGMQYLRETGGRPDFLTGWFDRFDPSALFTAGEKFDLNHLDVWQAAIRYLDRLKEIYRTFPQTFNYSDFAGENLALTRDGITPLRAIVFDYDCFTTGAVYSDYRNVIGALEGPAQTSFQETYGPIHPDEAVIDSALSLIEGIVIISRRPYLPDWGRPLLESIRNGEFTGILDRALAMGDARSNMPG